VTANEAWGLWDDFLETGGVVGQVLMQGPKIQEGAMYGRGKPQARYAVVGVVEGFLQEAEEALGTWHGEGHRS